MSILISSELKKELKKAKFIHTQETHTNKDCHEFENHNLLLCISFFKHKFLIFSLFNYKRGGKGIVIRRFDSIKSDTKGEKKGKIGGLKNKTGKI